MKEYFLHNGQQQQGPFSFEELKSKGINTKTMIWFEGIAEWIEAGKLDELTEIVSKSPPEFRKARTTPPPLEKAKQILNKDYVDEIENKIKNESGKKVFKIGLVLFALIGVIVVILQLMPSQTRKERNHPTDFLLLTEIGGNSNSSHYGYSYNNKQFSVSGKLKNLATKTKYKDFKIEVQFFSSTNTLLVKKEYILYKEVNPIEEKYINEYFKEEAPEGTSKISWKILDATGINIEN